MLLTNGTFTRTADDMAGYCALQQLTIITALLLYGCTGSRSFHYNNIKRFAKYTLHCYIQVIEYLLTFSLRHMFRLSSFSVRPALTATELGFIEAINCCDG
jgi:hypothetical protein